MAVITVEQPLLNAMKELATATKKQGISEAKIRMYMEMGEHEQSLCSMQRPSHEP